METKNIFDQVLSNAVLEFEKIDSYTNITSETIIREPEIEERDKLWNITRVFVDFIYKQDLNLTNKQLRDKVCHYSIVALHWNDLQIDNKEFSYSNGRFRRDTVALALCLFSRLDNSYKDYYKILDGWVLPHTNFSLPLWTLRSIIDSNRDNFFNSLSLEDAQKASKYLSNSFFKNRFVDYNYLIDNDQDHPLLEHWWKIRLLFKFPNVDTWIFLRRYIWNSIDVPGGLGLHSKDRDINKDFLKIKSESIEFPKEWKFKEKLMFLFIFFCFKMDNELDDAEKKFIKKYWQEWNEGYKEEDYNKIFDCVNSEFNKNSSIEKLHQCIHDIKTHFINLYKKDDKLTNEEFYNKLNTQLSLILKDLMWISYSDGFCDDKEFKFIEALRGIWGVQERIFPEEGYTEYYNTKFDPNRRESFPEMNMDSDLDLSENNSQIKDYPIDFYYQTKLDHWNCLIKNDQLIKHYQPTGKSNKSSNKLKIIPFPNIINSNEIEKDLFRDFSNNEIDLIVKKINSTKSCIYLTWINETLKSGLDNRGFKSPFWFMPFVCYGFDVGSFLIFEQNGIFTNYRDNDELTCVLHVDLWDSVTLEKGWNGLLDIWVKEGYRDQSDLQLDIENITSLKIEGTNPQTGEKIVVNFVDTHGPGKKSTLHIIKAIWDSVWKETVATNKDSSVYVLPRNNEYFNSWDELLIWAKLKDDNTKGNNETP